MEFINANTQPIKTEDFIQSCELQRFYEVQRYDLGKTIKVELKPNKESLKQYQFPYTEQGLQHAKAFAFDLYKKTACRELRSYERTFSSKKNQLIVFMVKYLGFRPEYKKTIKDINQKIEKARAKKQMKQEEFEAKKLIIKDLPDTLNLNKLMSIGDTVYLLEVGRLLEDEGIEISEMKITEALPYSNFEAEKNGRPDFKVIYGLERFTFNLEVEYKNHPERIVHAYLNQALFFKREDAEKERQRIVQNLQKYL